MQVHLHLGERRRRDNILPMRSIVQAFILCLGLASAPFTQGVEADVPQVSLNHFFVVVDEATFEDIRTSEYLRETFAVTETKVTQRSDATYSGFYVYGENTYFEILTRSLSLWESAIILSGDQAGDLERIRSSQLPQLIINQSPITREYRGSQIPWFTPAENLPYPSYSKLGLGLMEYHPSYLTQYYPNPLLLTTSVSRRDVLARYASILGIEQSDRLLKDVIGITANVARSDRFEFSRFFETLGFEPTEDADSVSFTGNAFKLTVASSSSSISRVREVRLQLREAPDTETTLEFGENSLLHITDDGKAVWSFQ